jgi:hypothetical protein
MKRMAVVVDSQGMIGVIYVLTQSLIRELEPVDQRIDEIADVERQPDRVDCIPNADKVNLGLLGMTISNFEFLSRGSSGLAAQQSHQNRSVTTAVSFICSIHAIVESFCGRLLLRIDNTAFADETREGAYRESTAAKAEQEQFIARIIDAAEFLIELLNISAQTPSGYTGENLDRPKIFSANAIIVNRHLRIQLWVKSVAIQIDGLKDFENIRAAVFHCGVSSSVRANHNVLRHGFSVE